MIQQHYQPKRLAPVSAPPPSCGGAGAYGPQYILYILPDDVITVTEEDLARFPPLTLGDEEAARSFLDRALAPAEPVAPAPEKRGRGVVGDILFYLALAALLVGVFLLRGMGGGAPVTFAGFSAMRVLTSSMDDVIPQGSLIVTRQVDPRSLELGDDITYMATQDTTVTHRIVDIAENYNGTGQRAFTTQGTMNEKPDELKVPAANVVGKVVFHSLLLGQALSFVRAYWFWIALLLGLCMAFLKCLRVLARDSREERQPDPAGTHKL